jgi:hypothetical protein
MRLIGYFDKVHDHVEMLREPGMTHIDFSRFHNQAKMNHRVGTFQVAFKETNAFNQSLVIYWAPSAMVTSTSTAGSIEI